MVNVLWSNFTPQWIETLFCKIFSNTSYMSVFWLLSFCFIYEWIIENLPCKKRILEDYENKHKIIILLLDKINGFSSKLKKNITQAQILLLLWWWNTSIIHQIQIKFIDHWKWGGEQSFSLAFIQIPDFYSEWKLSLTVGMLPSWRTEMETMRNAASLSSNVPMLIQC